MALGSCRHIRHIHIRHIRQVTAPCNEGRNKLCWAWHIKFFCLVSCGRLSWLQTHREATWVVMSAQLVADDYKADAFLPRDCSSVTWPRGIASKRIPLGLLSRRDNQPSDPYVSPIFQALGLLADRQWIGECPRELIGSDIFYLQMSRPTAPPWLRVTISLVFA